MLFQAVLTPSLHYAFVLQPLCSGITPRQTPIPNLHHIIYEQPLSSKEFFSYQSFKTNFILSPQS